jgi:hypothetical protein
MPQYIIHKDGAYNIFSTVVDAPYFDSALTLDQLKAYTQEQYGLEGMRQLDARLERAHKKGCSAFDMDLEECISCNRAGPDESEVPLDEFVRKYLTLQEGAEHAGS